MGQCGCIDHTLICLQWPHPNLNAKLPLPLFLNIYQDGMWLLPKFFLYQDGKNLRKNKPRCSSLLNSLPHGLLKEVCSKLQQAYPSCKLIQWLACVHKFISMSIFVLLQWPQEMNPSLKMGPEKVQNQIFRSLAIQAARATFLNGPPVEPSHQSNSKAGKLGQRQLPLPQEASASYRSSEWGSANPSQWHH